MNDKEVKEDHLTLQLLGAIEKQGEVSQRHLAKQMGVALGLTNSYLKRCVRKGYIKIRQIPANRYLYYLTPKGFAEKSRLASRYLSRSFSFYRRASNSCAEAFAVCKERGWNSVVLCGASDLAEIAAVRAIEMDIALVGLFAPNAKQCQFVNRPVFRRYSEIKYVDAFLITELELPGETYKTLVLHVDPGRVLVPNIFHINPAQIDIVRN